MKNRTRTINESEAITLNAYLAQAGICSRRKAVEIIKTGSIQVNNQIIMDSSYRVGKEDLITYKGRPLELQKKVYILLNKPKGYISTVADEKNRKTVIEIVSKLSSERLYPIGRLDRATTGLLLLTNDGQFAQKLAHPKFNVPKIYRVTLARPISNYQLVALRNGIQLEDGFIKPNSIEYASQDGKQLEIQISSGRNRIIRRIFESIDYKVTKLDRTKYAFLTKKQLPQGHARFLDQSEVKELVKLNYKKQN